MKKILAVFAVFLAMFGATVMTTVEATNMCGEPVFAEVEKPKTSILNGCADKATEGDGAGVMCILSLVLSILTYGVGILGVIGIIISGIQYMTSQGDPSKMAKAKSRILQVVIGLLVYAIMWAALRFLVPGFELNL